MSKIVAIVANNDVTRWSAAITVAIFISLAFAAFYVHLSPSI